MGSGVGRQAPSARRSQGPGSGLSQVPVLLCFVSHKKEFLSSIIRGLILNGEV